MVTKILSCVLLYFLRVELTDGGVTQTPRHKVAQKGQAVTLRCEPIPGHDTLFWYRQTMVQGLELLIFFRNQAPIDDTGMPKDRFSASMPETSFSTLKIEPTEPRDSALYLCASSLATALQNHPEQVQKPCCFPFSQQLP
ncbi:T-cell receptor beta chain V region YT35 [Sciurus carolinensis]|nr:T-cell receptor beta chain V region YT35 [Sciurus carolinensis]